MWSEFSAEVIDHSALSNDLPNFSPKRGYLELETEKGNEVKTVVWLRRIAHFPANVGQGPSDLCGQNFESYRSVGPV